MSMVTSKKTLRELALVIFSRWLTILLMTVIVTGATVAVCQVSKKVYRSQVTLWARQSKSTNPLESNPDPMSRLEVFLKTQQTIILSDSVLRRTLARLDNPKWQAPTVTNDGGDGVAIPNPALDQAAKAIPGKDVAEFRKKIKVTTPGGEDIAKSEVFTIAVEQAEPPERAQLAAAILTEEYLEHYRVLQARADESSRVLLEQNLNNLREKILGTAEKNFNEFIGTKIRGNLLEIAQLNRPNGEVSNQRLRTAFQEESLKIDAEISEYQALQAEVKSQIPAKVLKSGVESMTPDDLKTVALVVPEKVLRNNGVVNKLRLKLADLIVDRNSLSEQYTKDFKLVTQKQGEIFRVTCDIINELSAELKAIDQHITTLQARKAQIDRQVKDKDKVIDDLSSQFVQYESLMREVELSRTLYEQKRKEVLDVETAKQMAQREILISRVDPATLPDIDRPVRPILWLYTLLAAVVGLLLGTAWAFLADSYDHTVRTIDQAERYLGKPVLVSIPEVRGGMIR